MRVSIVGTGYVGLVTGVCLAEKGHDVICVDIDQRKVDSINAGRAPIHEAGLDELLGKNIGERILAVTDLRKAVVETDLSLIAVGTPFDGEKIDLSHVKQASVQIGNALKSKDAFHTVVVKSTVVPGTTEDVVRPILEQASGKTAGVDFGVGMNPEFLREGEAVQDFMNPDRIVLGGIDEKTIRKLEELYAPFRNVDKISTTPKTAEMIKYASNSLLATMISFSNELGNLCSQLGGIDIVDVMRAVHLDRRLSPILPDGTRIRPAFTTYLEAGCGFGGSCFPKDVKALIAHGENAHARMSVLDAVMRVNERQPEQVLRLFDRHFPSPEGVRVAVLGLAFKPGTDDVRESPAIPIVRALMSRGVRTFAYDPVARKEAEKIFVDNGLEYCDRLDQAVHGKDAVVILTRWPEFNTLPDLLSKARTQPVVIDGRRMLDKRTVARYDGIGL